jgi:hypothetical protein
MNEFGDPKEWVLSLEEEKREDMKFLIRLHLPCLFAAFDVWHRRTVRAHPARARCSRLRFKAVDSVRLGGTVISPCTDGRKCYGILTENLEFHRRNGTAGRSVWCSRTGGRESYR